MTIPKSKPDWIRDGARFRLVKMAADPDPIPAGSTGTIHSTVYLQRGTWHLNVRWDPEVGRSLNLAWPADIIEPIQGNSA